MFLLLIMCVFFLVFLVPVYKWFLCNCDNPLLIPGSAWSSKFWCAAWHFWQAWHSSWFPIIYECVRLLQLKHWPICAQTLYGCDMLWCVDFNTLSGRTVRVAALIVYQTLQFHNEYLPTHPTFTTFTIHCCAKFVGSWKDSCNSRMNCRVPLLAALFLSMSAAWCAELSLTVLIPNACILRLSAVFAFVIALQEWFVVSTPLVPLQYVSTLAVFVWRLS